MAFRFRRSARLGPLRFHFSKNGLSSISVGSRGASAIAIGPRQSGLLALIETPEALSRYVHRFQSQDDAKRRGRRCIEASQLALQHGGGQRPQGGRLSRQRGHRPKRA